MAREFEHMGVPESARGHKGELRILYADTMRLSGVGVTRLLRDCMIDRFPKHTFMADAPFFVCVQKREPTENHPNDTTVDIAFLHKAHVDMPEKFFRYTFDYEGDRLSRMDIDPSRLHLTGEQSGTIASIAMHRRPEQRFSPHDILNAIYFPMRAS